MHIYLKITFHLNTGESIIHDICTKNISLLKCTYIYAFMHICVCVCKYKCFFYW